MPLGPGTKGLFRAGGVRNKGPQGAAAKGSAGTRRGVAWPTAPQSGTLPKPPPSLAPSSRLLPSPLRLALASRLLLMPAVQPLGQSQVPSLRTRSLGVVILISCRWERRLAPTHAARGTGSGWPWEAPSAEGDTAKSARPGLSAPRPPLRARPFFPPSPLRPWFSSPPYR